jgi:hypothetical protein
MLRSSRESESGQMTLGPVPATMMRLHYEAVLQAEEGQPAPLTISAAVTNPHNWIRLRTTVLNVPYHQIGSTQLALDGGSSNRARQGVELGATLDVSRSMVAPKPQPEETSSLV